MIKKYFGIMAAVAGMLLASCSDDDGFSQPDQPDDNMVDVTFTITAETSIATRAEDGSGEIQTAIGKGEKIDMLIYAVYLDTPDGNGHNQTFLTQYGKGVINNEEKSLDEDLKRDDLDEDLKGLKKYLDECPPGDGQTVRWIGDAFREDGSIKLTFRLMKNEPYRIAFWAQSHETAAFDASDLRNVKVNYDGAENNDEFRDAFCKVEVFSVASQAASGARSVILTRPFAQINIGTTGADYKTVAENLDNPQQYKYSMIKLTGVANRLNVVEDIISIEREDDQEGDIEATFTWEEFPGTKYGTEDAEEYLYINLDDHPYEGHQAGNGGYLKYLDNYPTVNTDNKPLTETFKYLSMCYVLVPSEKNNVPGDLSEYASSILPQVDIFFSTGEDGGGYSTFVSIENVPVHRNWRTNILGGLGIKNKPNSIFNTTDTQIMQNSLFFTDGNNRGGNGWTGTPPVISDKRQ